MIKKIIIPITKKIIDFAVRIAVIASIKIAIDSAIDHKAMIFPTI